MVDSFLCSSSIQQTLHMKDTLYQVDDPDPPKAIVPSKIPIIIVVVVVILFLLLSCCFILHM